MNYLQSGLDLEDEDALLDDASTPYDSLTDRIDKPDFTEMSIDERQPEEMPPQNPVADMISKRYAGDPILQQYQSQQGELDSDRNAKRQADVISNIGNAFSQIAQGSNAPKPNTGLYENLAKQSGEFLKTREQDLDRQGKVMAAIENRKTRQAIAQGNQHNKDLVRNTQVNRLLGMTEKELRDDPIAKPSELNLASLEKAKSILTNDKIPLTSQMLSDAEQDIASALQLRGQGATEGKIRRTELDTLGRKIAEAKQKWGNKIVDLRVAEPELVQQIKVMNQALADDYKTTIAQRKHSILDDREAIWGDDPTFSSKLKALRASVAKRYGMPQADSVARKEGAPPIEGADQAGGGLINSANAGSGKQVLRKQYSESRNQTRIKYKDGSEEILDGKR